MSNAIRDQRLFGDAPKRILSLDGGGIRGIVTVGMLEEVERVLRARQPADKQAGFVLADHFDLVVGTSTGSIIATLLALGESVESVRTLYLALGPAVFSRPRFLGQFLWSKFDYQALGRLLEEELGAKTLESQALRTGLLITCKRVDTGSAWILGNNPQAKYWEKDRSRQLRELVRASTAAPSYFAPAQIHIGDGETGLFLDGAMGGLNNPSVAAFLYATADEYGLRWKTGEDRLSMLSLGTGFLRPNYNAKAFDRSTAAGKALKTLKSLIYETQMSAIMTMEAFSNSVAPFKINGEVGGLEKTVVGGTALLKFERFDPPLAREDLKKDLDLDFSPRDAKAFTEMDNGRPKNIERLLEIGRAAGRRIPDAAL